MTQENLLYLEMERSGGHITTFRPKFRVEVKDLSTEERMTLDRLIKDVDFFHQPTSFSKSGTTDTFEYHLTVKGNERSYTIVFHDEDGHPNSIDILADWIRTHQSK